MLLSGTLIYPGRTRLQRCRRCQMHLPAPEAHVPEAQFVFAGEGPERPELEAQAKSLGIEGRVTLLGLRDDVPDLLACCDLLVLPSLSEDHRDARW